LFSLVFCNCCVAVAEQALTSQQRPATANHAAAAPPPAVKPEVTSSALLGDRKQRNAGSAALQQLNITDFRIASATAAGLLLTTLHRNANFYSFQSRFGFWGGEGLTAAGTSFLGPRLQLPSPLPIFFPVFLQTLKY